ncbi:hypothetical protein ZOSMA_292G00060 [Zostera marina]|uniref:Transmembrane protein n=1 Tax=Zostera marina TaxID=29655 RepID=A0A0K9PBY5_ZOSMR|nr:hypothetical protein ZOSMA_292G00060 [Zostera marina]
MASPKNPPENGFPPLKNKSKYPNPPDAINPDSATLREQLRYARRMYSRWYSSAWGSAILAGLSFFALGWVIKGENPIPSLRPVVEQVKEEGSPPTASPTTTTSNSKRS